MKEATVYRAAPTDAPEPEANHLENVGQPEKREEKPYVENQISLVDITVNDVDEEADEPEMVASMVILPNQDWIEHKVKDHFKFF